MLFFFIQIHYNMEVYNAIPLIICFVIHLYVVFPEKQRDVCCLK